MPIQNHDLEKILINKFEFVPAKNHSKDHRWYELQLPGLPKILTMISHSRGDISLKLEGKIARQLRVKKEYFRGMVSCTNSKDNYYQSLVDGPQVPWEIRF